MSQLTTLGHLPELEQLILTDEFKQKFVIDLKGKDFINFDGLMILAHARGMKGIKTELTQSPNSQNDDTAIVHAIVLDKDGGEWHGTGDASTKSVGKTISNALVRMAETRAIGRALRMMLGIGTMMEEVYNPFEEAPITNNQISRIAKIMKQRGFDKEFVTSLAKDAFSKTNANSLTSAEASAFITLLENVELPFDDDQEQESNNIAQENHAK